MLNSDLIAYLQPAPSLFDALEWRDVTGRITDIRADRYTLRLSAVLTPGLYRCRLQTEDGAFDMETAMMPMVRVPDGKLDPVGPWDFDHINSVMAMPMARTYVNGRLVGGMWFDMPGPEDIERSRLNADFGFEAEAGVTELTLEFVERDRDRIDWPRVKFIEIREDERAFRELAPLSKHRPRIYMNPEEADLSRDHLADSLAFRTLIERINNGAQGTVDFDLVCFAYLMTKDADIGETIRTKVVELCRLPTWSGKPDPLVMGGENDRGIALKLYMIGLAWDWCASLFAPDEQTLIKGKVEEYIRKLYEFTVLQRAYMGCPTPDPHSLGTWNGTAIACMAFYEDLEVARKALPFFHGLFTDSLQVFPQDGKNVWVTYFPFHLIRYLAAAHTFGGMRPELQESSFLDRLGNAMLASFRAPNSQELQRGLRTREHRYLSSFLNRFHPTPGISSIYETFVDQERRSAGDVDLGLFDFLFAPRFDVAPAPFPSAPFFAKDIGSVTFASSGGIAGAFTAGLKAGRSVSFHIQSHNREFPPSMGGIQLSVDGSPVLVEINSYGLDSSLGNTMCFDDGGSYTQGQYLNGNAGPEKSSYIRRCLIGERFIYAHAVIKSELHPRHHVKRAERIVVVDLRTGAIVVSDSFEGDQPLLFATHLHCSGSVKDLGEGRFRLTGGQANLIAGIKDGDKGLSDEEKGEVFVTVLNGLNGQTVRIEDPIWHPTYIYGLNGKDDKQDIRFGRFPHYKRWRLEYESQVREGDFLYAITSNPGEVAAEDGVISFKDNATFQVGNHRIIGQSGCEIQAEAVISEAENQRLTLLGTRAFRQGDRSLTFAIPVDIELELAEDGFRGTIFASTSRCLEAAAGTQVSEWQHVPFHARSHSPWQASFRND
ncbi:hypothetical protein D7Z26_16545 [Cohnella endophytica]|uniref:Uncharacterized protein n=1 Tax=Cohnella endophytica TaxID=2419778 RepID=A0A494XV15_9BACL|nr:hypothetical protein [Cohnella endophytica]RKP51403.1 hypothetical protein D7Z26_16545 [Cohnella endophytica]